MTQSKFSFEPVVLSLADLLGPEYVEAACAARAFLSGEDEAQLRAVATERVDFYPEVFHKRLLALLPRVGEPCCPPLGKAAEGATSAAFQASSKPSVAPVNGLGFLRIGEGGRLFLTLKSEHYHVPLGHAFPGYRLVDRARDLGIPNATHNNTRGHITRLLEQELVCAAASIPPGDRAAGARRLDQLRASRCPTDLNRVLNLETGSLAVEAAIKMCLSRFYQPVIPAKAGTDAPHPTYDGRIPVLIVLGDDAGGLDANYHGTTMLAQVMRGMWPDLAAGLEREGTVLVRSVRPNNLDDLETVFGAYDKDPFKIAGFFHELVLMNYAARRLTEQFVQRAYALCEQQDVPTVVDEIQTGIWSPELFLFREYGVKPWAVALGKGFPGGECPASRLLFSSALDTLPQFGALVTNGQEELASLTYLITMRWAQANADAIRAAGDYYRQRLNDLAERHPHLIGVIEGRRHLAGIHFHDLEPAKAFAQHLNEAGLDISVQTYKIGCPPCPLTKLPITADGQVVDVVIHRMEEALKRL